MWIDVDTAITVFVNSLQLIDDTDFKTIEEAIAYDAAGMDLNWNFETTAGVISQTNVTPTTGGDYDWTHVGNGIYKIEIPASGGVSVNNDTEGFGFFSGFVTGVLPFRGPAYGFRAAALNNALIDGGDNLDVNTVEISGDSTSADNLELDYDGTGYNKSNSTIGTTTNNSDMRGTDSALLAASVNVSSGVVEGNLVQMGGVVQSATDLKDFADAGYDPATNKVEGVKTVDTTTTNTDMRGTDNALLAANVNVSAGIVESNVKQVSDDATAANNLELDYDGTGLNKSNSTIGTCTTNTDMRGTDNAATAASLATAQSDLDTLTGSDGATLATSQPNYAPATAAALTTHDGKLDTVDTNVDAIKAKTDNLPDGIKKNTALNGFPFYMVDSTDDISGKTGLTVTASRAIDGAAFASCTNSPTEISGGAYKINLSASDLNGDTIMLKFTATGANDTILTIVTQT
jgi:hypothetical protein